MRLKVFLVILVVLVVSACAQVPKESVELSATVGRDIAAVSRAHHDLAKILFDRMKRDVNRFVDQVYAPFQIRAVMERQGQLATSQNPDDQKKCLLIAINAAFKPNASPQLQELVLKGMASMVGKIRDDVESMRRELLDPIEAQEREVLDSIDRAYQQIHYANSIVTGHLSSVAKVHDAQDQMLRAIGVERDLSKDIGENLAKASDKIGDLVERAETVDDKIEKATETAQKIKSTIIEFGSKLKI